MNTCPTGVYKITYQADFRLHSLGSQGSKQHRMLLADQHTSMKKWNFRYFKQLISVVVLSRTYKLVGNEKVLIFGKVKHLTASIHCLKPMPEQLAALGSSKIVNVIKNCKWKRALTNAQLATEKLRFWLRMIQCHLSITLLHDPCAINPSGDHVFAFSSFSR